MFTPPRKANPVALVPMNSPGEIWLFEGTVVIRFKIPYFAGGGMVWHASAYLVMSDPEKFMDYDSETFFKAARDYVVTHLESDNQRACSLLGLDPTVKGILYDRIEFYFDEP